MLRSFLRSSRRQSICTLNSDFNKMPTHDSQTSKCVRDSFRSKRPECGCNSSMLLTLLILSLGVALVCFATLQNYFNRNIGDASQLTSILTSVSWILLSFGGSFIIGSTWRILQHLTGQRCILSVPSSNISALLLSSSLFILSVIGFIDYFVDNFAHSLSITIEYPWWLSTALLMISVCCLVYVSRIHTKSAARHRLQRQYLMNHYFDKMVAEEGAKGDFVRREHRDKLPEYITKHTPPIHPYDRSLIQCIWHLLTHWHMFSIVHSGTKKIIESYHCYYAPKRDDVEFNFNKWSKVSAKLEEKHGKGINTIC